jgi:nucleotide-binding universal stress UspA family protein
MTRLLIAVDGSAESTDAARFAHRLFGDTTEYIVLTVADSGATLTAAVPIADPTIAGAYVGPEVTREAIEAAMHNAEETASEGAEALHAPSTTTLADIGDPGDAICRIAQEHAVDLIVIGSHDRNWLSRLVAPSVRNYLVEHAPCPVLVVR